jgi:hypothetical protein
LIEIGRKIIATKNIILLFVLLLLTTTSNPLWPDEPEKSSPRESKIESLRGIKSIEVLVENINEEAEKDGLKRDQILNDVELRLREHGIKNTPIHEKGKQSSQVYLYINLNIHKLYKSQIYIFGLNVELHQMVSLTRAPSITVFAITWDREITGKVGRSYIHTIREDIIDSVDIFANDFLSVNQIF